MPLQITFCPPPNSAREARDVGYLLEKHPDREFEATVSEECTMRLRFTQASAGQATVEVTADIDPLKLARGGSLITDYVNDTAYSASSVFWQGFAKIQRSALGGRTRGDASLVEVPWQVSVVIGAVRCHPDQPARYFEPLGYAVEVAPVLDTGIQVVRLAHPEITVQTLMRQLYVLGQALDGRRHHAVSRDQIEKLLRECGGWLPTHPASAEISRRFMGSYQHGLHAAAAVAALLPEPEAEEAEDAEADTTAGEAVEDHRDPPLHELRKQAIMEALRVRCPPGETTPLVVELGCGNGVLTERLAAAGYMALGLDLDVRRVQRADRHRRRNKTPHCAFDLGSALYALPPIETRPDGRPRVARDPDAVPVCPTAIVATEVIEHLEPGDLPRFAAALFASAPQVVVVTTPDRDYNPVYGLKPGERRDPDHRFEWTASEFSRWGVSVCPPGYSLTQVGIGEPFAPTKHPELSIPEGAQPSQMLIFARPAALHCTAAMEAVAPPQLQTTYTPAGLGKPLHIPWTQRARALTLMRGTVPLDLLPYLPPTMSPCEAASAAYPELERPEDALDYYRDRGVQHVVLEQKHMGSRGTAFLAPDGRQVLYTRMGRPFPSEIATPILAALRRTLTGFGANWGLIDGELLPWGAKARDLIQRSFAPCGGALLARSALCGDDEGVRDAQAFLRVLWHHAASHEPVRFAPFCALALGASASDNELLEHGHSVQMALMNFWASRDATGRLARTLWRRLDTTAHAAAREVYEQVVRAGGEGIVVKPAGGLGAERDGHLVQPGIKVREPEYLRIIYGPQYQRQLDALRERSTRRKRALALQQHAMGLEALRCLQASGGVVTPEIHQWVFGILATEVDGLDPRL